jgi:hypothetical protein
LLSPTVALTDLLQKEDNDLIHAVEETKVIAQLLSNERNDSHVWDALYDKASNIAAEFDILPSRPRKVAKSSSKPRCSRSVGLLESHIVLLFLDHLVQEIEYFILSNQDRFAAQCLLPKRLHQLQVEILPAINAAYAPDLDHTFESLDNEVARLSVRWNIAENRPVRLQKCPKRPTKTFIPVSTPFSQFLLQCLRHQHHVNGR